MGWYTLVVLLQYLRDANNVGYWSTDRTAIEVKYMYIDVGLPYFGIPVPMNVRVGAQPLAIRPWFFQATDGMGVSAGLKIDPVNINPFYFKPAEGVDWTADDTDIYGLQVNAKLGTFTVGGYGLYYNMNSYPMWVASSATQYVAVGQYPAFAPQIPGTDKADFWWIGLYADGKAGPINIQLDAAFDRGKVVQSGFGSVQYQGWATRVKAELPWEKFNFGVTGMYATGSDADQTSATGLPGTATANAAGSKAEESMAGWSRLVQKTGQRMVSPWSFTAWKPVHPEARVGP